MSFLKSLEAPMGMFGILFTLLVAGKLAADVTDGGLRTPEKGLEVRVQPVDGRPPAGKPFDSQPFDAMLQGISESGVQLAREGGVFEVPFAELTRITRRETPEAVAAPITAGLIDGSVLVCQSIALGDDQVTFQLRGEEPFRVPVNKVRWVRFRRPTAEVDEAWRGLLGKPRSDDLLVIRRSASSIDQVPGIIESVDASKVVFKRGTASIDAPLSRLEGIVLGGTDEIQERLISLVDLSGSVWAVKRFEPSTAEKTIAVSLGTGMQRNFPLERLQEIRFADTSLLLASLEPAVRSFQPLLPLEVDPQRLDRWMGPRVDAGTDLVVRSRSTLSYRVDPKYQQFSAILAPDPKVTQGTGTLVQILLDETVVWEGTVVPGDEPRGLQFDLNSARRITFKVDYGENDSVGDSGDVVRFVRPRLLQ